MPTITTSEALARFIQNKTFEVEVGSVRPATLTKAEEFVSMLGENLPDTDVEALDPQDFRRLIQTASKRWGPLRLKQLRSFVLGWLRWCLEDEGLIERMPRTGSLKTPKVVAKPKETYTPEQIRTFFNDLDPWMVARGEHAETPPRSPGGLVAGVRAGCEMPPELAVSISRVGGDRSGPPGRTARSHRGRARSGPTTRRSG